MRSQSYIISLLLIVLIAACGKNQKAKRKSLEGDKTAYLIGQMKANEFNFDTFSSKANFTLIQDEKKTSFKSTIRIKKDSLIWISITPLLGIEMARIMIMEDSVKVINRLAKEYFLGDGDYINKRFNIDMDFEVIQALLLGNSIAFELDEKIKVAIDKEDYYLGNMKKRKARKAEDKPQKVERKKEEVISLWINQSSFKIDKFLLSDLTADRFIRGEYKDQMIVNDQRIPEKLHFEIQSDKPAIVEIEYSKVEINEALRFPFKISSKYEKVLY